MNAKKPKHTVAILREIIGLTQKQLAELVGKATGTIVSIEQNNGRLKLSEELAKEIGFKTGVDWVWLMENDPARPPLNTNGEVYTSAFYKKVKDANTGNPWCRKPGTTEALRAVSALGLTTCFIEGLLTHAVKEQKTREVVWRLTNSLQDLIVQMGAEKEVDTEFLDRVFPKNGLESVVEISKVLKEYPGRTFQRLLKAGDDVNEAAVAKIKEKSGIK